MKFTYESYKMMLKNLMDKGYSFKNYLNWDEEEKTVILRHDVDNSLKKAVLLSEVEKEMSVHGATYFVLLSTNFYNVHSKESRNCISNIIRNGGSIGLHFDEAQYDISSEEELKEYVCKEIKILSEIVETKVNVVSMHRPSEKILSGDVEFAGIINSYSDTFFHRMKYLSDSRRCWRENIDDIIMGERYARLHILTHPFWYMEGREKNLKQTLKEAMIEAAMNYYDNMDSNFRNLESELARVEIEKIVRLL